MANYRVPNYTAKTFNTTDVWEEIQELQTSVGPGNGTSLGTRMNDVETSLAEKARQADLLNFINTRNKTSQPSRKRYYFYDSFARTSDSNTSLGNAETNNQPYTILGTNSPVWGVVNGQAYVVSASVAGRTIAQQEFNESDGILECIVTPLVANTGIAFRVADINNFWLATVSPTGMQMGYYNAGSFITVVNLVGSFSKACKIIVKMKGNKIEFFIDGILQGKTYNSFNNTATKHGLYSRAEGVGTSSSKWDNLDMKPDGEVLYNIIDGFEDSSLNWYWTQENAGLSYSQTFSNTIKNNGSQSLRMELNSTDPVSNVGNHRSEIKMPAESPLEEHWYGVSIYLPNGGSEDYAYDVEPEILVQWHGVPDVGEDQVSPPLALHTEKGHYWIHQCWQPNRITSQQGIPQLAVDLGDYSGDKGKWVNWVFHVKWGWSVEQDPVTEVYKDGILVYQNNGQPNCFNDASGVYQKLGIYKWVWDGASSSQVSKRVAYYDDYWMK